MKLYQVILLFFVSSTSLSALGASFVACSVEAKLKEVGKELRSNSGESTLSLEMTFEASKVTDGECDSVLGSTLTKEVSFNHKDSIYELQEKVDSSEEVTLEHSYFKAEEDGEDFIIETWALKDDGSHSRSAGDDGHY